MPNLPKSAFLLLLGATIVFAQMNTEYLLTQLPIGQYSVKVNALNFKQAVLSNVDVHVGDTLRHDFTVQIGDANETVIVEAINGDIQPESAEIKDVIQSRQIVNMPLKTRQFLDLAMLSEGVVRPPGGTRGERARLSGPTFLPIRTTVRIRRLSGSIHRCIHCPHCSASGVLRATA